MKCLLLTRRGENGVTRLKLLIIVDSSATYSPDTCKQGVEEKQESIVFLLTFKVLK